MKYHENHEIIMKMCGEKFSAPSQGKVHLSRSFQLPRGGPGPGHHVPFRSWWVSYLGIGKKRQEDPQLAGLQPEDALEGESPV